MICDEADNILDMGFRCGFVLHGAVSGMEQFQQGLQVCLALHPVEFSNLALHGAFALHAAASFGECEEGAQMTARPCLEQGKPLRPMHVNAMPCAPMRPM